MASRRVYNGILAHVLTTRYLSVRVVALKAPLTLFAFFEVISLFLILLRRTSPDTK